MVGIWLLSSVVLVMACAAEAIKKSFDLPADVIEKSLKRFSEQSGLEVLFPTDAVEGVRTQVVRGTMTSREALDRMLAGTDFGVVQDPKSGALTVRKHQDANGARPATKPNSRTSIQKKSTKSMNVENQAMKPRSPFALLGALLAVALAPAQAADSTSPTATGTAIQSEDDVLHLSPFIVESERGTGYQAASTLAGTRLNTPIKDLGASISVYTRDFLNDLGTNNVNELLVFGTGTEAGGPQGNYSGATGNINATEVYGSGIRSNPEGATRIRGLGAPNYTRGYFATSIPTDFYNVDSVTVNRGPNSILFGAGNPAGVINTAIVTANLERDSNDVLMRYGNNDSIRASFDINRVLIPNKVAARIAAVDDNEEYNQRPAFERKKRIFGALAVKPFASTTVRGSFESGTTRANRPLTVLPQDTIAREWYEAGMPVWDWTYYDDPARNPNAAAQVKDMGLGGPEVVGGAGYLTSYMEVYNTIIAVYPEANATAANYAFDAVLNHTSGTALNSVRNNLYHPLVNRDSAADGSVYFISTRNTGLINPAYYPDGRRPAGMKLQGFTDFDAFDFKNRMLDEVGGQRESFHNFNVSIEQLAWKDRLGIELAYYGERYDRMDDKAFMGWLGNGAVRIDTMVTLPTGKPNPNLGRPYMLALPSGSYLSSERESTRATGFARYDFKDVSPRLGKWLGRHTLTGLWDRSRLDSLSYLSQLYWAGTIADAISANRLASERQASMIVYLGDSILDGSPLRLNPISVPVLVNGQELQTEYFDAPAGSTAQGDFKMGTARVQEITRSGSASRTVIKSKAFVLQSHWLDEHLVTTLGWRRDEGYFQSRSLVAGSNVEKIRHGLNDFSFDSTPPPRGSKEVKSGSAVLRWPQKLARLPFGIDGSVFVNVAENFTPASGRVDMYNQSLGSPEGETEEVGFNLSFLDGRFNMRLNRFETSGKSASYNSAVLNRIVTNILFGGNLAWVSDPTVDRMAEVEKMFAVLPSNVKDDWQWKVTGNWVPGVSGSRTATYTNLAGRTDTTDFVAKGTEAEFAFNPTPQWRFILNVAKQETVQTNLAPITKEFVARLKPVWDTQRNLPHGQYPTTYPGVPLSPGVELRGPYLDAFVYGPFNQILATEGTVSPEQRKWRANFVGSYEFNREGRFKGWSVGTGVRWQDKFAIGYPSNYNSDGLAVSDLNNPYYGPAETNVDFFAGYTRKIWDNRILWKAQLNVRNAIGEGDIIGVTSQPTGEIAVARLAPERRWYLTNTFSF